MPLAAAINDASSLLKTVEGGERKKASEKWLVMPLALPLLQAGMALHTGKKRYGIACIQLVQS